jgi:GntR family transcriptional regulator
MDPILVLSQKDSRPMYLQIIDQIKHKIAVGDWPRGYRLPSIRELAISTGVSVITVKRAYQELEAEQVIFTQQGRGSFVADGENMGLRLQREALDRLLGEALASAGILGMSVDELAARLRALAQDGQDTSAGGQHD